MDVANAVLDGTDAVMLSAETAADSSCNRVPWPVAWCRKASQCQFIDHHLNYTFTTIRKQGETTMCRQHLQGVKAIVG